MSQAEGSYFQRLVKERARIAWTLLALLLILLPVVAVSKLIVATDEELDDVVAQAMIEFTTVTRVVPAGSGGNLTYDVAILKAKMQVRLDNVFLGQAKAGWWRGNSCWDLNVDKNEGAVLGATYQGSNFPLIMNGIRLEIGFDQLLGGVDHGKLPDFLFLRIGTDSVTGLVEMNPNGGSEGCLERLSSDARIQSNLSVYRFFGILNISHVALPVNQACVNSATMIGQNIDANQLFRLYYGCTGPRSETGAHTGDTDIYVSFSDTITDDSSNINSLAWNPHNHVNLTVPGQGWWIHFQRVYAHANNPGI